MEFSSESEGFSCLDAENTTTADALRMLLIWNCADVFLKVDILLDQP